MFVYNADTWCDSCGERIQKDLIAQGTMPENPLDHRSFDSDEFPKHAVPGETDSPSHCAAGSDCLEGLDLREYGHIEYLKGAESFVIGKLIEDDLTDHGVEYLREMLDDEPTTPYQSALHTFWRRAFSDYL